MRLNGLKEIETQEFRELAYLVFLPLNSPGDLGKPFNFGYEFSHLQNGGVELKGGLQPGTVCFLAISSCFMTWVASVCVRVHVCLFGSVLVLALRVLVGHVGSFAGHVGSLVAARGLSSCGTWAYLLCCMWDLSSPTKDRTQVPWHCKADS